MNQARALQVLHVAPTPFFSDRGCHIRIEGIVKALNQRGVDSLVCTYHHGRDRPQVEVLRITPVRNYTQTKAGPDPFKYLADLKLLWLVCKTVRQQRPDVIHGHLHEGALLGWLGRWLGLRPGTPMVVDIQGGLVGELDSYGYFDGSRLLRRLFGWIEYLILRMPHHVFCSSISSMAMLQRQYRLSGHRLSLLGDRVDAEVITDGARPGGGGTTRLIYSGSLLASKGLPLLLEVIERLLDRRKDVDVVLVGYPVEETAAILESRGLEDRCVLTGQVDYEDLPGHLRRADIGLDPKMAGAGEGSGKILNYMAAGLPVVAFESDNNRDFLGPQQELVPDGSVDGFVDRIELLVDDPAARMLEGERNRNRARLELTWDAGIDLVLHTYERLLDRRSDAA